MPDRYDIADPNDPTTLRIPFMFVPRGCEPDPEWLRKHPGAIRFPATMVPREPAAGGTQWNVQFAWPEPLTAESLPPPPSRAKATISVPIDRRDDLPGDDSQRTPDAPPPAPLTLDDPAVAYTLWTGEDPIDVWRRMSAVFDDPIGAIKGTLLAAQTTASSGAPNVVASPSRIEASRADERAAPVPFVDDQGKPVLDEKGKQMLRPAGLDPHFFVKRGVDDKKFAEELSQRGGETGPFPAQLYMAMELSNFDRGAPWDAQRIGGSYHGQYVDYATVAIGLYAAAAGIPKGTILEIQNWRARDSKYPAGTEMDEAYTRAKTHLTT